jgi:WD40 repeat protein
MGWKYVQPSFVLVVLVCLLTLVLRYDGMKVNFSFELIMSAHDTSFRAMAWSHNKNYLLTCDASGNIKYWSPSIAPVQSLDSHNQQAIHALSFSPSDTKFVSCGDDSTVRVWDWASHSEERVMEGHGWDVKTVQWHPRSSVIASGSKGTFRPRTCVILALSILCSCLRRLVLVFLLDR